MVKTGVLNDKVQQSGIYRDLYENSSNDESVEPSQLAIFFRNTGRYDASSFWNI